ncbi:hypothetical protein SELMODRAFT_16697, partial [Selaginella moellendorffii]
MPDKDLAAWNAMVSAHAQHGDPRSALKLFRLMDLEGVHPDEITYVCALDSCSTLASPSTGKIIHEDLSADGLESASVVVTTALLSMYAKCGQLHRSRSLFDRIANPSGVSWNAMISAYAQNGHPVEAFDLFALMIQDGARVDHITFQCVLFGSSHAGSLEMAIKYLSWMMGDFDCAPLLPHFICVIDLLGRSGRL